LKLLPSCQRRATANRNLPATDTSSEKRRLN
jgi:hypothetical protein